MRSHAYGLGRMRMNGLIGARRRDGMPIMNSGDENDACGGRRPIPTDQGAAVAARAAVAAATSIHITSQM